MTDGFDIAKSQRNILERLGEKIPGYRGFQDRELRREVDKLQREHLSTELTRLKAALRERARAFTEGGNLAALGGFDRLDREIDELSQTVRFSDYGATGIFDVAKIGEPELARVYELDLSVVTDLGAIESAFAALPAPGAGGGTDIGPALEQLRDHIRALGAKWQSRKLLFSNVVQTGPA